MKHETEGDTNCYWCAQSVTKGLVQGLEDWEIRERVEIIQTTKLLRSARILRRDLEA